MFLKRSSAFDWADSWREFVKQPREYDLFKFGLSHWVRRSPFVDCNCGIRELFQTHIPSASFKYIRLRSLKDLPRLKLFMSRYNSFSNTTSFSIASIRWDASWQDVPFNKGEYKRSFTDKNMSFHLMKPEGIVADHGRLDLLILIRSISVIQNQNG